MIDRVAECVHPEAGSCRGCNWSYEPSLFDGGCKLHYEREADGMEGLKSPPPPETGTKRSATQTSAKSKGEYNPGEGTEDEPRRSKAIHTGKSC